MKKPLNLKPLQINTDIEALYEAVQRYIENRGGKLVVIGGVEIIDMPQDNMGVFHFAVKCMGKKPQRENTEFSRNESKQVNNEQSTHTTDTGLSGRSQSNS